MPILNALLKYLVAPFLVAAVMYILVHFQLLIIHKLLGVEHLTHKKRTAMNLITFFSVFFAVLALVILNDYLVG